MHVAPDGQRVSFGEDHRAVGEAVIDDQSFPQHPQLDALLPQNFQRRQRHEPGLLRREDVGAQGCGATRVERLVPGDL